MVDFGEIDKYQMYKSYKIQPQESGPGYEPPRRNTMDMIKPVISRKMKNLSGEKKKLSHRISGRNRGKNQN